MFLINKLLACRGFFTNTPTHYKTKMNMASQPAGKPLGQSHTNSKTNLSEKGCNTKK
jgi:hypothetical protein